MNQSQFHSETQSGETTMKHDIQTNRISIIEYKQKQIVCIDFSDIKKPEEIYQMIEKAASFISKKPTKSLYTLTNLSGMHFNNEIFNRFIAYVKGNNPYVIASAVLGMNGMMQIFYNSFTRVTGRDVRAFSTEQEAKEFLANK
jgi:hypothetical protein